MPWAQSLISARASAFSPNTCSPAMAEEESDAECDGACFPHFPGLSKWSID